MPNILGSAAPVRVLATALALAAVGAPSFAQAQSVPPRLRSEALAIMQVCRGDYDTLCTGIVPGGGRILACLQTHANQLSPACANAMTRAEALKNSAITAGVMPK